jgi:KDO2-lipid IV(A) lauroyltransferase
MRFWTIALAFSLGFLIRLFPKPVRWWIGVALGTLWFDILRFRRWTILKNLTIAFPEKSHSERLRLARRSTHFLCYNLIEILQMPLFNQKWLEQEVVFHGLERFEKAKSEGKGVLILSMHIGNGDVAVAAISLRGFPLNLISKRFKNAFANQLWFGIRERHGTRFLEPHGPRVPFEILKLCRQNQAVVFVIDQFMGRPYGIETTFFGKRTGTAYGLALFAMKTQAPVLPVYTYRGPDLKTHVVFEEPVAFEKIEDKDLQIQIIVYHL